MKHAMALGMMVVVAMGTACDRVPNLRRDRTDDTEVTSPAGTERSPTPTAPTAWAGGNVDPCGRLSECCSALAKLPDMEDAKPLCQMFWLQEIVFPMAERTKKKKVDGRDLRDICSMELAELGTLWLAYASEHPKAGKIPAACDYTHPDAGRMPAAE